MSNEIFKEAEKLDSYLSKPSMHKKSSVCSQCKVRYTVDTNIESEDCFVCGSLTSIDSLGETPSLTPDYIVPHSWGPKEAMQGAENWVKRQYFSPGNLKTEISNSSSMIKKIYVPYWSLKIDADVSYTISVGKPKDGSTQTVYTLKTGAKTVKNIKRTGCAVDKKMGTLVKKIEPFNVSGSSGYSDSLINEEIVVDYNVLPNNPSFQGDIKKDIEPKIIQSAKTKYMTQIYNSFTCSVNKTRVSFNQVLMPIYIINYKYGDDKYAILINGQNGKVKGEAPFDYKRIGIAAGGLIFLVLIIKLILSFMS